jgi:hypothetical protein
MNVGGVVDSPTHRRRTLIVVSIVVSVALTSVYLFIQYRTVRTVKVRSGRRRLLSRPGWSETLGGVAIYVIADASAKFTPDLRGRFWEKQIKSLNLSTSVNYVSDAEIKLPANIHWIIPPYCVREGVDSDPGYCYRNVESWSHFVKHESKKRWYFKVGQDAFVNVANLLNLIDRLEGLIDPMTEAYFQFTIDETNGFITPHGPTGWLISNAALKALFHHAPHFTFGCDKLGESVGMAEMILNMQLDIDSFISPYFIAQWPSNTIETLTTDAETSKFSNCPKKQYRYSEKVDAPFDDPRDLVVTRMPFVPMNKVEELLKDFNRELRIGYPADDQPIFCYQSEPEAQSLDAPPVTPPDR